MGVYCHLAICKECEKIKCKSHFHGHVTEGDFAFEWEWYNKADAIEKITHLKCPCCGSEDWYLLDCGNR